MLVKAKYYKEVEVTDSITPEEIDHIVQYGMPDRFDNMADSIDNEKPLTFEKWEFVNDKHFISDAGYPYDIMYAEHGIREIKIGMNKESLLREILIAIICAVISGLIFGIKNDILFGICIATIAFTSYITISFANHIYRMYKFNKEVKGEKK